MPIRAPNDAISSSYAVLRSGVRAWHVQAKGDCAIQVQGTKTGRPGTPSPLETGSVQGRPSCQRWAGSLLRPPPKVSMFAPIAGQGVSLHHHAGLVAVQNDAGKVKPAHAAGGDDDATTSMQLFPVPT